MRAAMALSFPRRIIVRGIFMLVTLALAALPVRRGSAAVDAGPQGVVRQFCQADALGQRVSVQGWETIGRLVGWSFEPAWDHVVLINGYAVDPPSPRVDGALKVDVRYDVLSTVSALGVDASARVETVTLQVRTPDGSAWRIDGPPPPPHILGNRVDVEAMRQSLELGGVNFLADAVFVWRMYRSAGWDVDFK